MRGDKYLDRNLNITEEFLYRISRHKFNRIEYIGELVSKLQKLYDKSLIDEVFFKKALELFNKERENVLLENVKYEREEYINVLEKIDNFKELEQINDFIKYKLENPDENKNILIEKLNDRFAHVLQRVKYKPVFEDAGDLCNFLSSDNSLINEDNKENAYKYIDENCSTNFDKQELRMVLDENKERKFETEKYGIKMKLIEAKGYRDLEILSERILDNLSDKRSENYFKTEFERSFIKIFDSGYLGYICDDLSRYHVLIDLDSAYIDKEKIIINNKKYFIRDIKGFSKNERTVDFDDMELNSIKHIIKYKDKYFSEKFIKDKLTSIVKISKFQFIRKENVSDINNTCEKIIDSSKYRYFRGTLILKSEYKFNDRLKKCCKSYDKEFNKNDVVFLFDNTIFKTGEKGFVFTYEKIYIKNENEECKEVLIENIDDIELKGDNIYFDDVACSCDIISKKYRSIFRDALILITYLVQNIKDNSKDNDDVVKEVLSIVNN